MSNDRTNLNPSGNLTTRRAFLTTLGFSVLSLGGLWGFYGALTSGGRGGGATTPQEFKRQVETFTKAYKQPDNSVKPPVVPATGEEHVEVYLLALQWGYLPNKLRLKQGTPYLFKMSCLDVAHGASIQMGRGSLMARLSPGIITEKELSFTQAGEYLLYCTYYCGYGHDFMQGKIIVEA